MRALFKSKPRNVHAIRKTKKHHKMSMKQESLDVEDSKHSKVNAHYYKENHHKREKQDLQDKKDGKKDAFALDR